jgi:hypothetical protein
LRTRRFSFGQTNHHRYREYGELSRPSYDELARSGISREVVDQYIAGQQAIAQSIRNDVFNAAGGQSQYEDMTSWAAMNLSPSEIRAYDSVMGTGNTAAMKLAVDGLKSKFEAANGVAPKLMGGHASRSVVPFARKLRSRPVEENCRM